MRTRTSRSLPGVLLDENAPDQTAHNDVATNEMRQLPEAYVQQYEASPDSFGAFVTQVDLFRSGNNSNKTLLSGDDNGGGTPPGDSYKTNGNSPDIVIDPHFGVSNPQKIEGDDDDNVLEGSGVNNKIYGYGGDDTIYGHNGNDQLFGGDGEDDIFGGDDADYIEGGDDADNIYGEGGNDDLNGGEGNDNLFGGPGDDLLRGDGGNDVIFGEAGDDTFIDNGGNDTYNGGEGSDTFAFYEINFWSPFGGGHDLIEDFELGVDKLKIGQFDTEENQGLSFNEFVDQFASGGGEAGVVIEWANGLIRLAGIDKEDLNPWDIVII